MLDVKYKELGGSGLVTTPLNMAPNLSECNVSHAGIAHVLDRKLLERLMSPSPKSQVMFASAFS